MSSFEKSFMPNPSPTSLGFRVPAEWEPHRGVWLAWPCARDLWQENLDSAQTEFAALCQAIADVDWTSGRVHGDALFILVPDEKTRAEASQKLKGLPVEFFLIPYGDIWLRDTAPVFATTAAGDWAAIQFKFNGWGEKYSLPFDRDVAAKVGLSSGQRMFEVPWVMEGGSVEVDGEGTCLTSRQCLLNPNRNADLNESQVEHVLRESLGVSKVLWVTEGMINDHTDGHIDTIARYVKPGHVAIHRAMDSTDPNREIYERIEAEVQSMTDAKGRRLRVSYVPSPGSVLNSDGELMPASHLNFYIGNSTVVVPTYGTPWDEAAVAAVRDLFPNRKTVGLSAKAILTGGGAFHCITQQWPANRLSQEKI